jgi:hypothetical protein
LAGRPANRAETQITERQLLLFLINFFPCAWSRTFQSTYTLKPSPRQWNEDGGRDGAPHLYWVWLFYTLQNIYIGYGKQRDLNTLDGGSEETSFGRKSQLSLFLTLV